MSEGLLDGVAGMAHVLALKGEAIAVPEFRTVCVSDLVEPQSCNAESREAQREVFERFGAAHARVLVAWSGAGEHDNTGVLAWTCR